MGICASDRKDNDHRLADAIVDLNWKQYDKDKNGTLDKNELKDYCKETAKELVSRGCKIHDIPANDDELLKLI